MRELLQMTRKVNVKTGDKLRRFCAPLIQHFGISHFYHYQLSNSGHYAAAGLNQEWHECFFSNSYPLAAPYLRNPKKVNSPIIFTQAIEDKDWKKVLQVASKEFNINLGLQLMNQTSEGVEAFGFGLKSNDSLQHFALLNELPLIHRFIHEYRKEFPITLLKDNFVDLASLIGPSFNEVNPLPDFLNFSNPLTRREQEVIEQLLKGYSAAEIGARLFLSKRTVENHLERLKDKFDCNSKAELIQKSREMESMGFLA